MAVRAQGVPVLQRDLRYQPETLYILPYEPRQPRKLRYSTVTRCGSRALYLSRAVVPIKSRNKPSADKPSPGRPAALERAHTEPRPPALERAQTFVRRPAARPGARRNSRAPSRRPPWSADKPSPARPAALERGQTEPLPHARPGAHTKPRAPSRRHPLERGKPEPRPPGRPRERINLRISSLTPPWSADKPSPARPTAALEREEIEPLTHARPGARTNPRAVEEGPRPGAKRRLRGEC
jgi:hypothetical protein